MTTGDGDEALTDTASPVGSKLNPVANMIGSGVDRVGSSTIGRTQTETAVRAEFPVRHDHVADSPEA